MTYVEDAQTDRWAPVAKPDDWPYFPERLAYWTLFQVGFALFPVVAVMLRIEGGGLRAAIEHGELVLVGIVITGAATAAAVRFTPRGRRRLYRAWLAGWSFVVALLATAVYTDLQLRGEDAADLSQIVWLSVSFLAGGLIIGVGGSYLEHVEETVLRGGGA